MVQNLVDNALKYSTAGAVVTIGVETHLTPEAAAGPRRPDLVRLALLTPDMAQGLYTAISVGDEGPGMARENLPRLTERFYRVEGQKSGERSGTGLGLAIVKHIANRHRGGLSVESGEGRGTTFTAYFPQAVADAPAAVAKVS
ncbi:sensor histidine kinase [Phenylobacterium sp. J367]|uniref:sensor histidine kinase n=1 Tax=Phenylobacterium sp. J367 TaxID=2898435 RepID=UPI0035ADF4D4